MPIFSRGRKVEIIVQPLKRCSMKRKIDHLRRSRFVALRDDKKAVSVRCETVRAE